MDRTMPPIPGATPPPIDPFTAWKQSNPIHWKMEQFAMQHHFPGFTFVNESRPAWRGVLSSPRLNQDYTVEIILNFYNRLNDNPEYLVIPLAPYINELFPIDNSSLSALKDSLLSWQKISDSDSLLTLHLEKEEKPRSNQTAASHLLNALDWFEHYESEKNKLEEKSREAHDLAAQKRAKLREKLLQNKKVYVGSSPSGNSFINSTNSETLIIQDHLVESVCHFIPNTSECDTHFSLKGLNQEFLSDFKKPLLKNIPFDYGIVLSVTNSKISFSPVFEFCCNHVLRCWHTINDYQKLRSELNYTNSYLIDPNLFLESFKKDMPYAVINGRLSKHIDLGTGLKTIFLQEFYINVDELRFRYNDLEVFIVYTLKHLGQTFINLSSAYDDYRFIYCREMLKDVISTSSYSANISSSNSDNNSRESPLDYMPYGVYCYKNLNDNSVHILHYIWAVARELMIEGTRGYYLRDVIVRCNHKFDDEISYSDLDITHTDTLITKFNITN